MSLRAKKYFKDYDYEEVLGEDGKIHGKYVYHGDVYIPQTSDTQRKVENYFYFLLSILAGVLIVLAMLRESPSNYGGFFSMISIISIVPMFCIIIGSFVGFFKKKELTKNDYQERRLLLSFMPLIVAVLRLITMAGYLVSAINGQSFERRESLISFFMDVVSIILYLMIFTNEMRIKYSVQPGTKPSENKAVRSKV